MKGKIDKYGTLYIERAGKMKDQLCPYSSECGSPIPCSDTCPLFGEPKTVALDTLYQSDKKVETALVICHGKCLVFDQFTDERVGGDGV